MKSRDIEKFWLLSNKLRGTFDISDWLKLVLYALLFKNVEFEKEEIGVYDNKYSLSYLALTYGKVVNVEEIIDYIEEIEISMGLDKGIMSQTLESILKRIDDENARILFGEVDSLGISSKAECYELALTVVHRMTIQAGRVSGQYCTSPSLAKLQGALLDIQEGMSVYDGFCGTGVLGNIVAGSKGTVYLQDINVETIGIAAIITVLSGNSIGRIGCADTLHNPLEEGKTYDRVVMDPPLGCRYDRNYLLGLPENNFVYADSLDSDTLALRHAIASLEEHGMASVLVSMGVLFKIGRAGDVRQRLLNDNNGYIDAIIELPRGVIASAPGVNTALVILKKGRTDDKVYMLDAKSFFTKADKNLSVITDDNILHVADMYKLKQEFEDIAREVSPMEIIDNNYNLCPLQYVIAKSEDGIVIEDTAEYVKQYDQLLQKLTDIDKELNAVRSRFVKEA